MISFESDYTEGAHPAILQRLLETNDMQLPGYGIDPISESAKEKIRLACGMPDADVWFLTGGTQTNKTVIASILGPCEGAVAVRTGHIGMHEGGAIEATGHKVLTIPSHAGKMDPHELRSYLEAFFADESYEHMVFPGLVYISYPTEYGTLYTKAELTELSSICREYKIPLFLDGARLGYGLCSDGTDVTLHNIASLCDVFYIGGTKVGALCGEAVVFSGMKSPAHFFTLVKQQGALLAKGRLNSIQFDVLFTDDLYFKISRHAIDMAMRMKEIFREKGYSFYYDSPTNQQFVILTDEQLARLSDKVGFTIWESIPGGTVVRFATSWATKPEALDYLESIL